MLYKSIIRAAGIAAMFAVMFVGGAFAQRVGDVVQITGSSETWRVESAGGDRITLVKAGQHRQNRNRLDGAWDKTAGGATITAVTFSGSGAVMSAFDHNKRGDGHWHDAYRKGFIKVGDPCVRNIQSAGATTWTCEVLDVASTDNYRTSSGIRWDSGTITMQADGTIRIHSSIWQNSWDMIFRKR